MNPDIVRWNEKYRAAEEHGFAEPDSLLVARADLLPAKGRVLDLACGAGANAIFAARHGCRVVGADASIEGLRIAARRARAAGVSVSLLNADLEVWRPPEDAFDMVMVFRYLDRGMFSAIESALRARGVLIYKTFNQNFLRQKPDMNPAYLLRPGELKRSFPALTEIAASDDGIDGDACSWWIGRKP